MISLSELPQRLPELSVLVVHGGGRGGGESVADKIRQVYAAAGIELKVVSAFAKLELNDAIARQAGKAGTRVLFTSGMRDLPAAAKTRLAGVSYATYLQVPYLRALSFSDPAHLIAVLAMIAFHRLFSAANFVNSQASWPRWYGAQTLVPITDEEFNTESEIISAPSATEFKIVTAFRMHSEHGSGSKDIKNLVRLAEEIRARNRAQDVRSFKIIHYGDVDSFHKKAFFPYRDVVELRGYSQNWVSEEYLANAFVFLSNYEGFGLAPLEATKTRRPVYVNEGFPQELLACCPVIRINTLDPNCSILAQIADL